MRVFSENFAYSLANFTCSFKTKYGHLQEAHTPSSRNLDVPNSTPIT